MIKLLTKAYRFYNFYSSVDKYLLRRAVRKLLAKRRAYNQVLEIGAGTAMMKSLITEQSDIGQHLLSDVEQSDTADVVCDAQNMPFDKASFDLLLAFEVLEHIPDADAFFSEAQRVLTVDGELLLSVPFIYGRHDFQDFHRWTPQGLRQTFTRHGLEVQNINERGGTALAINRLFVNFIHDRMGATKKGWRAKGLGKTGYFGVMTAVLVPVTVLSWFALAFDVVFDRNSANPIGYVLIGTKQGTKVEA